MGWFDSKETELSSLDTDELQARLKGLCHKIIARQVMLSSDADMYEALITELTRRKQEPIMTVQPKK